jgi:hypothetical protein
MDSRIGQAGHSVVCSLWDWEDRFYRLAARRGLRALVRLCRRVEVPPWRKLNASN